MKLPIIFSLTALVVLLSGCATPPPPTPIAIGNNEYVLTVADRGGKNAEGNGLLLQASELAAGFCWTVEKSSLSQILESETREAIDRYPAISRIRFSCRNNVVTNTSVTNTSITDTNIKNTGVTRGKKTKKSVRKRI